MSLQHSILLILRELNVRTTKEAKKTLCRLVNSRLAQLIKASTLLLEGKKVTTVSGRTIQGAVRLLEGHDDSAENVQEATRAVNAYQNSLTRKRTERAKLTLSVPRVHTILKQTFPRPAFRIGTIAPVYAAAVLENTIRKVIQSAIGQLGNKKRITPRHIEAGIREDPRLCNMFSCQIIPDGHLPLSLGLSIVNKRQGKKQEVSCT